MDKVTFSPIPCGETIPRDNPHAISVSMPSLQDVIDYEEGTTEIAKKIKSAYPRFVRHPYLILLADYIKQKYEVSRSFDVVILSSQRAAEKACMEKGINTALKVCESFGVVMVKKNTKQLEDILSFIQLTGSVLSSRAAQDYLFKVGVLTAIYKEKAEGSELAEQIVKNTIADAYKQSYLNVGLAPSGMNAVYAVLEGIQREQKSQGRDILVQLGWLYSDTMTVVDKCSKRAKKILNVERLEELEGFLSENGREVSAIITEIPTNPQLRCVDLKHLRKLCDNYQIPLIVDTTIATPYLVDFIPYADVMIESLSKFASGNADVLMGAVVINEKLSDRHMRETIFKNLEPVYHGDLQRMAIEVREYKGRVHKVSANAEALVAYFKRCSYVDKVFYHHFDGCYVGLVSVTFSTDFRSIYDELNLPKGPSLGTEFTLAMPYTYLAHYDYVNKPLGKEILSQIDLPVDLLRISVGIEPIQDIIDEFKRAAFCSQ
ncbi:MAG: PLP-dependent transferase [Mangrovibacterium sp.]